MEKSKWIISVLVKQCPTGSNQTIAYKLNEQDFIYSFIGATLNWLPTIFIKEIG